GRNYKTTFGRNMMADIEALQDRAATLFRRKPTGAQLLTASGREQFTVFRPDDQDSALDLPAGIMRIAGIRPGLAPLPSVLQRAEEAFHEHSIELVKYALMVFITHHPGAAQLPIPSLEMRDPEKAWQSPATLGLGAQLLTAQATETALIWFREDPLAN